MNIHANIQVFPFDCDSLDYYYTNDSLQPKINLTTVLNDKGKKAVTDYLQRLMQSKVKERFPGYSGKMFSIVNSDSTFSFKFTIEVTPRLEAI